LKIKPELIANALSSAKPPKMRGEVLNFADGLTVVDDSYNSNPRSLLSMVRTVAEARENVKRKFVIAGEMMELGPDAPAMHHEAGREIAQLGIDVLWGVRGLASQIVSGAREAGRDIREWTGTAWLEENTGNLVRIEARPCFQKDRMLAVWQEFSQSFGIIGVKTKARPHGFILAQVFDYERDGLLFPTRLDLAEFVWVGLNEEALDSRLVLTYNDYRFFKSEAQETIPPLSPSPPPGQP